MERPSKMNADSRKNKLNIAYLRRQALIYILYSVVLYCILSGAILVNKTISSAQSSKSNARGNGGDCAAIGPRRPIWDDRGAMLRAIPEFKRVYVNRPFRRNYGGMMFAHSFGLWYILRTIRPTPLVVVESGAHRGHSTWLIRQALPYTKIISISPDPPKIRIQNVEYYNSENFTDFSNVEWASFPFRPNESLIFFDDHQSAFKRIFEEGARFGFKRFIQEDNFGFLRGDSLSMKWICEIERKDMWSGIVLDDFGRKRIPQTWKEHISQTKELHEKVKHYYEFPPIVPQRISRSARWAYDENHAAPPLLTDVEDVISIVGQEYIKEELSFYVHLCYVELF